jgi:hypothetical protein
MPDLFLRAVVNIYFTSDWKLFFERHYLVNIYDTENTKHNLPKFTAVFDSKRLLTACKLAGGGDGCQSKRSVRTRAP